MKDLMKGDELGRERLRREDNGMEIKIMQEARRQAMLDPELRRQEETHDKDVEDTEKRVGATETYEIGTPSPKQGKAMEVAPMTPDARPWDSPARPETPADDQMITDVPADADRQGIKRKPDIVVEDADTDRDRRAMMRIEDDGHWIREAGNDVDGVDVGEAYSLERVVAAARKQGLDVGDGISKDLTNGWDFSKPDHRNLAARRIMKEKPFVLIISVMCGPWSSMMNANWKKIDTAKVEQMMKDARMHLEFACKPAMIQHCGGRYFVHEHPECARSWREPMVTRLHPRTGAMNIATGQCMYGHVRTDDNGVIRPI